MKASISINDELMKTIDEVAKSNYMSRSGFISFACMNYITQIQVVENMRKLYTIMKELSEKGMLDEEDARNLKTLIDAIPQQ